jgi:hypothetical protein
VRWQPTATGNPAATISAPAFLLSAFRFFRPLLFPVIQRRHGDFGVFRAGMMHRLGIVPQRLLCEPFRISGQKPVSERAAKQVKILVKL